MSNKIQLNIGICLNVYLKIYPRVCLLFCGNNVNEKIKKISYYYKKGTIRCYIVILFSLKIEYAANKNQHNRNPNVNCG